MNRNTVLFGILGLSLLALAVGGFFVFATSEEPEVAPPYKEVTAYDRTMGNPDAPVTIIEYAAPMCPVCAIFNEQVFPRFKAEYIDTGKARYVFRVFPIGNPDLGVEGIARCLPKEKYFPFIDMMYRNQDKWDPDGHVIPDAQGAILSMARIAGVPPDLAKRCLNDAATQAKVSEIAQDAQARFGITGTPSFVMDNQVVFVGVWPWEQLKATLDARLGVKPR